MTAVDEVVRPSAQWPDEVQPIPTISGAYLFAPRPHRDQRGFIAQTLDPAWLRAVGVEPSSFVRDSMSRTHQGVVRGLHLRRGRGEATLVRCSRGVVLAVMVDLRSQSPTFRNVFTVELRAYPPVTLYVPPGCAHGFQALTEPADVAYRVDREHDPAEDVMIAWDDPQLAISWPLRPTSTGQHDLAAASPSGVAPPLR
jgi:dTDP-4-dehydrorhamnose 3,5-epimerase